MSENLTTLFNKLRKGAAQARHLPRALTLAWVAARNWTLAWVVLLLVQGLLPVATVYLTREVVNGLVAAIRAGGTWQSLRPALVFVALMAAVLLLAEVLRSVSGWVHTAQSDLVQDHINSLIHGKSVAADLAFYESPEFYDHLHRARAEASYRPVALLESLGSLLQNGITLLAMGAVLIPFGAWLPLALLVSTLPAFYVVLRSNLRQHQWRLRATADERRTWYYDWLLTTRETAAELRLFGLGGHFQSAYLALRRRLRSERLRLARDQSLGELGAGAIALVVTGCAMAWMAWRTVRGLVTLGDLALFYQAFHQGSRLMRSLLENVGQLYANSLFLGNLFEFLALEPKVVEPLQPVSTPRFLREGIRFNNVAFRYPGSERYALRDFDLAIPAGRIAAVVGPNGAGKSTLIKLLCRFYDPEAGHIEIDGIDVRDLSLDELRCLTTVLFQEPVRYNATVAENIALGDLPAAPRIDAIEAAAKAAGSEQLILRLPHGYYSRLGRWFEEGTELSVGEWQRISLARALVRSSPIILLDEPTSAMDPWSEAEWLKRFRQLAQGRTALIITHRFATAMSADVIHVISDGQILESGAHDDLMAQGGPYAQAWTAQNNGRIYAHERDRSSVFAS